MSFHGFRGQRTGQPVKSTTFSQAVTRHTVHSFDQYGREYSWQAENNTGMPKSMLEPMFQAPWHPDPQYLIVNPDNTSEVFVDYPTMIADRIRGLREYHAKAVEKADKKGWPVPSLGEYSDDIVEACGRPPRPYQLAVAAHQENPWVLGKSDFPDPRLVQYLEGPTREIDEVIEHYDFGAASYRNAVAGVPTRRPRTAVPVATVQERAPLIDPTDAMAVADAYGVGESVGEEDETALDAEVDAADEALLDLDDEFDPEATGGRRVAPQQADRAAKQASRRPSQTAVPRKRGREASRPQGDQKPNREFRREGRRSLADGATPVVGDA